MGYDGKHCGEIEMANKIVREIIHASIFVMGRGSYHLLWKMRYKLQYKSKNININERTR